MRRYDPMVALTMAAAIHALSTRRPAASGVALGFGVALKGIPILLAPIFVLHLLAFGRIHRVGGQAMARPPIRLHEAAGPPMTSSDFLGLGAVLSLSGLLTASCGAHSLDAFAYHGRRPIQVETLYSGSLILAQGLNAAIMSKDFAYGSLNVMAPVEPELRTLSAILTLTGIAASWAFAWARLRADRDEAGRIVAVIQANISNSMSSDSCSSHLA